MELRFITTGDELYEAEKKLRADALMKPLGLPLKAGIFPFENESLHVVALKGGRLIGCALFHPEGTSGRLYQMAVDRDYRRQRIGTALLQKLEAYLAEKGFEALYLHAREGAVPFYERLGYTCEGPPFTEVGHNHMKMTKALTR